MYVNKKDRQARKTRAILEKTARRMFQAQGFAAVSAETIVEHAKVTRGALYHHYGSKEVLFEAVVESVMRELHAGISADAAGAKDPLSALKLGVRSFLRATSRPALQRVLLIDAPTVMGWFRWRELDRKYGFGLLLAALHAAASLGLVRVQSIDTAAHALLGAMIESSLQIAQAKNRKQALVDAEAVLSRMIDSLT